MKALLTDDLVINNKSILATPSYNNELDISQDNSNIYLNIKKLDPTITSCYLVLEQKCPRKRRNRNHCSYSKHYTNNYYKRISSELCYKLITQTNYSEPFIISKNNIYYFTRILNKHNLTTPIYSFFRATLRWTDPQLNRIEGAFSQDIKVIL